MPSWGEDYGGELNDEQIEELILMIQNVDWDEVYNHAVEVNDGAYPEPPAAAPADDSAAEDSQSGGRRRSRPPPVEFRRPESLGASTRSLSPRVA